MPAFAKSHMLMDSMDSETCEPWDYEDPDAFNECEIELHSDNHPYIAAIVPSHSDDLPDPADYDDPYAFALAYETAIKNLPAHYMHGIPATHENVVNRGSW